MQKISTVFAIDRETGVVAQPVQIMPQSAWFNDPSLQPRATCSVKMDGRACYVRDGQVYVRYDRKIQDVFRDKVGVEPITEDMLKPVPEGGIPCEPSHDPKTGHHPFWVIPTEQWILDAYAQQVSELPEGQTSLEDGTYELVGPKVRCNVYKLDRHLFVKHGSSSYPAQEVESKLGWDQRNAEGIKQFLQDHPDIEGLVFTAVIDGVVRYAKVRQKDFGFEWNSQAEGVRSNRFSKYGKSKRAAKKAVTE